MKYKKYLEQIKYWDIGETFEITEEEKDKPLNKPFRLPSGSNKKFGVYVKNDKGNVVKVTFGDPNMEIKRDDPERRKSFRARHQCDKNPGPKWKARYWSCKMWEKGKSVSDYLEENKKEVEKIKKEIDELRKGKLTAAGKRKLERLEMALIQKGIFY